MSKTDMHDLAIIGGGAGAAFPSRIRHVDPALNQAAQIKRVHG
jgi:hypothetical protein